MTDAPDADVWFTLCVGDRRIDVLDEGVDDRARAQFNAVVNSAGDQ